MFFFQQSVSFHALRKYELDGSFLFFWRDIQSGESEALSVSLRREERKVLPAKLDRFVGVRQPLLVGTALSPLLVFSLATILPTSLSLRFLIGEMLVQVSPGTSRPGPCRPPDAIFQLSLPQQACRLQDGRGRADAFQGPGAK